MSLKNYSATSLIGGGAGALDAIDGANLQDLDSAIVFTGGTFYFYWLDDDSGAAESSPDIISPDANAGNKRWLLVGSIDQAVLTTSNVVFATATLGNTGLHLLDTNASHDLIIKPGSDLTADRNLTITTGDAARTLTLGADITLDADLTGGVLDEDDMVSDDDTALATQQSIKAYCDNVAGFLSVPSGETILFYKDTAVTGYSLTALDDKMVYITKGSVAGGETGGGAHSTGTWTQPNHTHDEGTLIAELDAYNNALVYDSVADTFTYDHYVNIDIGETSFSGTSDGAIDVSGTTAGGATANTWRPAASCFTAQTRT